MMNCKEATKRIEKMQEGELNFLQRMSLHMHLMLCKYCHRFYHQWNWLRLNFKADPKVVMDEEQKQKIRSSIDKLS